MNKQITKKAHIILRYMPKTELSKVLLVSRKTLYRRLEDGNWNNYQIENINNIHNKIITSKNLIKICIENKKICMYFIEKVSPTKIIYPI